MSEDPEIRRAADRIEKQIGGSAYLSSPGSRAIVAAV